MNNNAIGSMQTFPFSIIKKKITLDCYFECVFNIHWQTGNEHIFVMIGKYLKYIASIIKEFFRKMETSLPTQSLLLCAITWVGTDIITDTVFLPFTDLYTSSSVFVA